MCRRDLELGETIVCSERYRGHEKHIILGDIISAFTAVASILLDLCHTRTTESESVTFNSSERIRGTRMAGRKRPETKKESVQKHNGVIIAGCVFN
jgi:hypothetical protein